MKIRKVVIPVAGWGTRSLPATKNIPKEMLPIVDKPLIQYAVEEAVAAGITDMGFIATQVGMFSYSGLTLDQMLRLREEFGVYGTDAGRICVAALNENNVGYVASSIASVVRG